MPEIKRSALEDICLSAKLAAPDTPAGTFLAQALDPPADDAIAAGIATLVDIGALERDEAPTHVGHLLESLPVDPLAGNLVLYGALFGCLDPILTIACAMSYQCAPTTCPVTW